MVKMLTDYKFKILYFILGSFIVIYYSLSAESTLAVLLNALFLSSLVGLVYFLIISLENRDNTYKENRKYKEKLEAVENEMNALFDNNNSYLWSIDLEKKTFLPSIGFEKIFGYSKEKFLSNYELWLERVIPEDAHLAIEHYDKLKSGQPSNKSFRFKNSKGEIRWLDAWGTPIQTNGVVTHLTGVAYDITERKQLEKELEYNAAHDYLTGLPNRRMLRTFVERELENSLSSNQNFALLYLDLDNFKDLNDHYGHSKGDLLLIQVSQRLKNFVDEKGIVSRQGGDEFVIFTPYQTYDALKALIDDILVAFELPFQLDGDQLLSASMGVSIYPEDGDTVDSLIGQADRAMYQAKNKGKNHFHFSSPILHETELRKQVIENDLFTALQNNEFRVLYQPKIILRTGELYGVEALLRWEHPKLGIVRPDEFIPLAEAKGVIHDLGLWVLNEVIQQSKKWEAEGISLTYAVNVSNLQFENPRFLDKVKETIDLNAFDPKKLSFEITETFMQNAVSIRAIRALNDMGIDIAIDDFGTGYSSLSILSSIPVNEIKIDRSFVSQLTDKHMNNQIVSTIIKLSRAFNCRTVAEGIETEEQAETLRALGCEFGQGYLYSRPIKPEKISELIFRLRSESV